MFQEHVFTLEGTYQVQVLATNGGNPVNDTLIVVSATKDRTNSVNSLKTGSCFCKIEFDIAPWW